MKSVCLLTRRPGSTREAFRTYYENRHARLGAKYFPFRKYLRNHLVSGSPELDFDTFSEFWFPDDGGPHALMAGPIGEIMAEDEGKFMDRSLIRPAVVEESLLAGPPRDIAPHGTLRQFLMLDPTPGAEAQFGDAVMAWGRELARLPSVLRVTLDLRSPDWGQGESRFPALGMLSLWLGVLDGGVGAVPVVGAGHARDGYSVRAGHARDLPPVPDTLRCNGIFLAEAVETTPEELAQLYAPDVE